MPISVCNTLLANIYTSIDQEGINWLSRAEASKKLAHTAAFTEGEGLARLIIPRSSNSHLLFNTVSAHDPVNHNIKASVTSSTNALNVLPH